jgi:hypothetical protein
MGGRSKQKIKMVDRSVHHSQEGFPWSIEHLTMEEKLAVQAAVDRAEAEFSAEIERIQSNAFKASQRAANKLRRIRAEIYAPYRIRATHNPQGRMTRTMREILEDVTTNGPQRYNGLMEKPIRALERMGLVTVVYDYLPSAIGRGRRVFAVSPR